MPEFVRDMPAGIWLAAFGLAALFFVLLGAWIARAWSRRLAVRRLELGRRLESRAAELLRRAGYSIERTQAPATLALTVDGESFQVGLRADLLARRAGRTYVVEVKSGNDATEPTHTATRRQLLEYSVAFGAPSVLLVDVTRRTVHEVVFDALEWD